MKNNIQSSQNHQKIEPTMTSQHSEHEFISSLLDGECTPEALDAYLSEIEENDQMLAAWEAFHVTREVLHHEEGLVLSSDFNRRLRDRLDSELPLTTEIEKEGEKQQVNQAVSATIVNNPNTNNVIPFKFPTQKNTEKLADEKPQRSTWWSMGLAASLTALMISGMWYNNQINTLPSTYSARLENSPKQIAQVSHLPSLPPAPNSNTNAMLNEAELDRDYLVVHHAYAPSTSIQGMAPYARAVFTQENSSDTQY